MGHNSDSDVMGTRVGGVLLTQVRSPPHWLTLNPLSYINLNPEQGSPPGGPFLVLPGLSDLSKNISFPCISCIGCA